MKNNDDLMLPLEYPLRQSLRIYSRRVLVIVALSVAALGSTILLITLWRIGHDAVILHRYRGLWILTFISTTVLILYAWLNSGGKNPGP